MKKNWEEFSKNLALEIKKEIVGNYLSEKLYLEEEWKNYQNFLEDLKKHQKRIFNNAWRIYFLLDKDTELIEEFENVTSFPLKDTCKKSIEIFKETYKVSEEELKKRLFSVIFSPFGFTSKRKFVKLFYSLYKRLYSILLNYLEGYKKAKERYNLLKKETERFHKVFDLSYILDFFKRFEFSEEQIGGIENRGKIIEELMRKLKIPIPPILESEFIEYVSITPPIQIASKLSRLAQLSFKKNPKNAEEILKILA